MFARKKLAKLKRRRQAEALARQPLVVPEKRLTAKALIREAAKVKTTGTQLPKLVHRQTGEKVTRPRKVHTKDITPKAEVLFYSGERKLLGISVVHKSCLQPVFSQQEAEDFAHMRR